MKAAPICHGHGHVAGCVRGKKDRSRPCECSVPCPEQPAALIAIAGLRLSPIWNGGVEARACNAAINRVVARPLRSH